MIRYPLILTIIASPLVINGQDAPLSAIWSDTGNYAIRQTNIGMHPDSGADLTGGSMDINVTGSTAKAYLYWMGRDRPDAGGDPNIDFGLSGGSSSVVTPDITYTYDHAVAEDDNRFDYSYFADVTSLISTGDNTYDVSGVEFEDRNFGAGLIVIDEDPTLPYGAVEILGGLDRVWRDADPGPGEGGTISLTGPTDALGYYETFFHAFDLNQPDADVTLTLDGVVIDDSPLDSLYSEDVTYQAGITEHIGSGLSAGNTLEYNFTSPAAGGDSLYVVGGAFFAEVDTIVLPEPSSVLLVIIGLSGLAIRRRR